MIDHLQDPIVLFDFIDQIPNGAFRETQNGGIAIFGHTLIYGMIFSDQNVTLEINQGCNDIFGLMVFRLPVTFAILAGIGQAVMVEVVGKFARARVTNASGAIASVETFFSARPYD